MNDVYVTGHRADQVAWAEEALTAKGYFLEGAWEVVRAMPWSTVSAIYTSWGRVMLKSMAKPFSKESRILAFLEKYAPGMATCVIAADEALGCFLMPDAGVPLRSLMQQGFQIEYWERAAHMCAAVQIATVPYVDELLKAGVNDWRLDMLPQLYTQLLDQQDVWERDGLTAVEKQKLQKKTPQLRTWCEKLASLGVPETLEHGDFQDHNILLKDDGLTISDWGDASITHPFFSCVLCVDSAVRNHQVTSRDTERIVLAYLSRWEAFLPLSQLRQAYRIAHQLHPAVMALSYIRFYACKDVEKFPEFHGFAANAIRKLLGEDSVDDTP